MIRNGKCVLQTVHKQIASINFRPPSRTFLQTNCRSTKTKTRDETDGRSRWPEVIERKFKAPKRAAAAAANAKVPRAHWGRLRGIPVWVGTAEDIYLKLLSSVIDVVDFIFWFTVTRHVLRFVLSKLNGSSVSWKWKTSSLCLYEAEEWQKIFAYFAFFSVCSIFVFLF